MQRYQRRRHLLMWLILTPLILAALVWGVLGRQSFPVEPSSPNQTTTAPNP